MKTTMTIMRNQKPVEAHRKETQEGDSYLHITRNQQHEIQYTRHIKR